MTDSRYMSDAHFYKDLPLTVKTGDPIPTGVAKSIKGTKAVR